MSPNAQGCTSKLRSSGARHGLFPPEAVGLLRHSIEGDAEGPKPGPDSEIALTGQREEQVLAADLVVPPVSGDPGGIAQESGRSAGRLGPRVHRSRRRLQLKIGGECFQHPVNVDFESIHDGRGNAFAIAEHGVE